MIIEGAVRRERRVVVSTILTFTLEFGFVSRSRRFERNKNVSSPSTRKTQYCGEPCPRGSVLGLRSPRFESYVWRAVSSQSSHHPREVLLAHLNLYVNKSGIKPDLFHFWKPGSRPIFVLCLINYKNVLYFLNFTFSHSPCP